MINEYERFLAIRDRRLTIPPYGNRELFGKRVLVTGGTGCIGSALIRQLLTMQCAKIGSIAIGPTALVGERGVHYYHCDIRDELELNAVMAKGWDVVFHTAAQRDPGLAEKKRSRTIVTNVVGMANMLDAAEEHGVEQFVYASTGKALRPFSPDTYTATKRIAEWMLSQSAIRYRSGARFTHVVDNSIVHARMLNAIRREEPIKLHADGILFYAQSALESAQLLIGAAERVGAWDADIHAIQDLGEPIDLTAMAHGLIHATGSSSKIEIVGYDPGYEEVPFPGLYDPATAFDTSPLINAFEAAEAYQPYVGVDAFPLRFAGEVDWAPHDLAGMSWQVMVAAMNTVKPSLAAKVVRLCQGRTLNTEHERMLAIIAARAVEVETRSFA